MRTLIVDRKGSSLSVDAGRLRIDTEGYKPRFVPLAQIERLVITAGVELHTRVLAALVEAGASVLILSPRDHRRVAIVTGPAGKGAAVRMAQYAASRDAGFCLAVARRLARMKLTGQRRLLLAYKRKRSAGKQTRLALEMLSRQRLVVRTADSVASLMGMEGSSAAAYFSAWAEFLPASLRFSGRNRRPPRDPVNAVLSLSYTLLHFDAVRAAYIAGLDPCVGFWHAPEYGRESLACDLIEPLRPHADRFVLSLFSSRVLRPEHFGMQQEACLLAKAGRRRFYEAWEKFAPPLRRALMRGVWKLKRALMESNP